MIAKRRFPTAMWRARSACPPTLEQSPLPFSQVIPNFVIMLIAFSYLVPDGLLLALSLLLMPVSLAMTAAAIWGTAAATGLL